MKLSLPDFCLKLFNLTTTDTGQSYSIDLSLRDSSEKDTVTCFDKNTTNGPELVCMCMESRPISVLLLNLTLTHFSIVANEAKIVSSFL